MNKKLNTILFILGATLFNVLVAILSFILLLILYLRYVIVLMPEQGHMWGFTFIFIASLVCSFFVYRYALKYLLKKIDVDKYFDPLFVRRNIRKN
ncbi:MAG: leader peptide processing enzyme [Treponema sp.]|jgi:hypothetical protein|nr:leader peptide processing enzyme [Treponema sp.]